MILVSRSSDRIQERRYHAAVPAIVAGTALVSLGAAASSPFFSLVLFSFAALGTLSLVGPFWSLPGEFLTGSSAGSGIALVSSITNLAGFAGPYAVGRISQRTLQFVRELGVCGCVLVRLRHTPAAASKKNGGAHGMTRSAWHLAGPSSASRQGQRSSIVQPRFEAAPQGYRDSLAIQ
jgi:ACS family tartrate transporter-like MFS transporter